MFKADESSALASYLDELESLKNHMEKHPVTYKKVREIFAHFKPLDLTLERLYSLQTLSVTELFEVKQYVLLSEKLRVLEDSLCFDTSLIAYEEMIALLDPENIGINSFYIYDGYSESLRMIRKNIRKIELAIQREKKAARIRVSEALGIDMRPSGEVIVKKHEVELIEKLDDHQDMVYVSDTLMHKTYRVNASHRVLSDQQLLDKLRLEEEEEEYHIRTKLTKALNGHLEELRQNMVVIGLMDLMMAKAYFALAFDMTKPIIASGLRIEEGIHLKVQDHLNQEQLSFMPISMDVSSGVTCVTGANMGGKTICLRLLGQMVTMAQYGLFVPCRLFEFEPLNFIFLSSQDAQCIDKGLSTFGAEMVNVSEVLKKADEKGLILIDELARGTNPKEGFAISKAMINYLKVRKSVSVITTHFDGLADEEDVRHLQVKGLKHVNFEDLKINLLGNLEVIHQMMDYRLEVIEGKESVPKDAIHISKLMGVDDEILQDARRILEHREEK